MDAVLQVTKLQNGNFAVRSIGGATLNTIVAEFSTELEAEEWLMRRSLSAQSETRIMRPGDGAGVA